MRQSLPFLPLGEGQGVRAANRCRPSSLLTLSQRGEGTWRAPSPLAPHPSPLTQPSDLVASARVVTMNEMRGRFDLRSGGGVARGGCHAGGPRRAAGAGSPWRCRSSTAGRAVRVAVGRSSATDSIRRLGGLAGREGDRMHRVGLPDRRRRPTGGRSGEARYAGRAADPHWAAGLCLANRRPGVRAVPGVDAPAAAAAAAAVGANLLVVDPQAAECSSGSRWSAEFCRGGVRPCPEFSVKRLGRRRVLGGRCNPSGVGADMRSAMIGTVTLNRCASQRGRRELQAGRAADAGTTCRPRPTSRPRRSPSTTSWGPASAAASPSAKAARPPCRSIPKSNRSTPTTRRSSTRSSQD